jgi:dihydrofolate synthase/folylpolyglutamate synthase
LIAKEERIQVQGIPIRKEEFLGWMNFLWPVLKALNESPLTPTFFDIMTTVCYLHFQANQVKAAVMEVGLGGRLDSTNTFRPDVCIITRLGMDHMEKLGNTLDKIAAEKAGIVKAGVPVISLPQEEEARVVLEARCREAEVPLSWVGGEIRLEGDHPPPNGGTFSVFTSRGSYPGLRLSVLGRHQRLNAAAAIAAVETFFQRTGRKALDPDRVRKALSEVRIPGRIDILECDPFLVVDGAHNPLAMEALLKAVGEELRFRDLHVLFACSRDKPIGTLLTQLAARARRWTLTCFDFPRIEDPEIVRELLLGIDPAADCMLTRSTEEALEDARRRSAPEDCILCCGSFYLVGEILRRVNASKRRD